MDSDCITIEVQRVTQKKSCGADRTDKADRSGKAESGRAGEGCGFMLVYPVIDMQETGRQLKMECERRQVSPRELQEFLGLAALQSVYGWFQGRSLPSLDNFYALSRYLNMQMEELVVPQRNGREIRVRDARRAMERRLMAYFGFCLQAEAVCP